MKVDGSLVNLIQGVSQQPDRERLPGQCTEQINMSSNPVTSLCRRAPTDYIKLLMTGMQDYKWSHFNSSDGNMYFAAYKVGELRVFTSEGVECDIQVADGSSMDYITGNAINFEAGDDAVFVADSGKAVQMLGDHPVYNKYGSIVFLLGGQYGRTYRISIKYKDSAGADQTKIGQWTSPDGSNSSHTAQVTTENIALQLVNALTAVGGPFLLNRVSDVIYISRTDDVTLDMSVTVDDGDGGANIFAINGQVGDVGKLSRFAPHRYMVKVVGTGSSDADDWYLQFLVNDDPDFEPTGTQIPAPPQRQPASGDYFQDGYVYEWDTLDSSSYHTADVYWGGVRVAHNISSGATFVVVGGVTYYRGTLRRDSGSIKYYGLYRIAPGVGTIVVGGGFGQDGVWRECSAPDQRYKWDAASMPHILTPLPDNSFEWSVAEWADRKAGDDVTNPPVSILGKTINDISLFHGRLVFAAGKAVVMSRTNKPTSLWEQSATALADDDPIDAESTAKTYTEMQRIVPHNRDLVVFSPEAQFIILGRTSITPSNAALVLTTSFECNMQAPPVPAGRNVFYAINSGRFTGIKEFYTDGTQDVNDSRPVTQHVKEYIRGKVRHMAGTSNFDVLTVLSDDNLKRMYVYEYLWVDDEKAQSSWSAWDFPDDILYCVFQESELYVLTQTPDGVLLIKLDLDTHADPDVPYKVRADARVTFTDVHDTVTMPYSIAGRDMVAVQSTGCPYPGMLATFSTSGNTLTFDLDMQGGSVIVGQRFMSRYKPTMPMAKDANKVKIGTGRLVLRRFLVQFNDTGHITTVVTTPYDSPQIIEYSGRRVGAAENLIGRPAVSAGTLSVPFRHDAANGELELQSDHHTDMILLDIEWEGQYMKRGQRMTSGG